MKQLFYKALLLACCLSMPITAFSQLLYEISGAGTKSKSYLFATNKLTDIQFLDSVPHLLEHFGGCTTVITEMQLDSADMMLMLSHAALLPDEKPLSSYYTPEESRLINDALMQYLGLSFSQIERMRPSYLLQILREEMLRINLGYDKNTSSEQFFQQFAIPTGKEIVALDNTQEALSILFEREPLEWQLRELLNLCTNPQEDISLENDIKTYYQLGQLNQIYFRIVMPDNRATISYSDYRAFAKRNELWTERLAPLLTQGNAFVVLDAIYLGGDEGLIAKLRAAGYRVRPANRKRI